MLDPGIGAVGAVLAQLDPFLTQKTKDTVRLYLADKLVRAEGGGPLLGVAATRLVGRGVIGRRQVVERGAVGRRRVSARGFRFGLGPRMAGKSGEGPAEESIRERERETYGEGLWQSARCWSHFWTAWR